MAALVHLGVYREEKEGGPGASSCWMELRPPEWRVVMWTQASRPLGFTEKVKTVRVENFPILPSHLSIIN
ncbi:hypothetical protein PS2_010134 [Malus domestica]